MVTFQFSNPGLQVGQFVNNVLAMEFVIRHILDIRNHIRKVPQAAHNIVLLRRSLDHLLTELLHVLFGVDASTPQIVADDPRQRREEVDLLQTEVHAVFHEALGPELELLRFGHFGPSDVAEELGVLLAEESLDEGVEED